MRPEDNLLSGCCQVTLIFCFIGGGYIWLFDAFSEQVSPQVASNVMAFASTTIIALPLIVVTLAMMVVMLIIMLVLIRKEGNQSIILLATTGLPPSLTIGEGLTWHLFLSHTWRTGQE